MPNTVRKINGKWRVVEKATGKVTTNSAGTPVDGPGHSSKAGAERQAAAININQHKKKRKR